jgi:anti-sigma regulatory factor (Ser/Thr protein kinase)
VTPGRDLGLGRRGNPLLELQVLSPLFTAEYTRTLPCEQRSAAAARAVVRTALTKWDMDELADDSAMVVSELVANAAEHTSTRFLRVTISRLSADSVRIAVTDKSHAHPAVRTASDTDESGRGLGVLEAVTSRWGTDPLPWGKRVWGELERKSSHPNDQTADTVPADSDDNSSP